jgi:hypothetical protein
MLRRTSATILAALALTAPAADAPAFAATTLRAAQPGNAPQTRIRLRVRRCVHCPVRLVQAVPGPGPQGHVWRTRTRRVRHGWVTFTVPTRRTEGMSIELHPRWSKLEAVSNVVIRYAHTRLGQHIGPAIARRKRRAEGCWAGTAEPEVTLRVRVVRFATVDSFGHHGYAPRAWLVRSHAAIPPMVPTFKGAIGNQDAFYCTP